MGGHGKSAKLYSDVALSFPSTKEARGPAMVDSSPGLKAKIVDSNTVLCPR